MENNTIKKINRLGKMGYVICKIGKMMLMIGMIICLICAAVMSFVPKEAVRIELSTANSAVVHLNEDVKDWHAFDLDFEEGYLEIGQNQYAVIMDETDEPAAQSSIFYVSDLKWILLCGALTCAAAYVTLHYAYRLCGYFKSCSTPFIESVSKDLIRLAWSLIPLFLATTFVQTIANMIILGAFNFCIEIDLTSILLILCVFMLSYVFKYGAALQMEADETL